MKVGIWIHTCARSSARTLSVAEVVHGIERAEELGFDSAWIMDHALIDVAEGRMAGHDPLVVLAHAAARTDHIRLGTLALCGPFRSAGQLAREAAALADAARGRFILGLGAGWYRPEFDAFDLPFDHLFGRLEEQALALRQLLDGGRVTTAGRYVRLHDAQVMSSAQPPPLWIAAGGPRMLRLAARVADGWNVAWHGLDASWLAERVAVLEGELAAAGRERASLTISAALLWKPDGDVETLARGFRAYEAAGADLVIVCAADSSIDEPPQGALEMVAEAAARL
ncbi:MAG TPA: LLM class flavin-dependent oxidoreductase [Candidatus Dormibacteraeota bacterium]|nr:LLM class flavin-dependent oxidoreductase [Candidatus Dormibacteraeota bacterium]